MKIKQKIKHGWEREEDRQYCVSGLFRGIKKFVRKARVIRRNFTLS